MIFIKLQAIWRSLLLMRNTHLFNPQKDFEHFIVTRRLTPLMPDYQIWTFFSHCYLLECLSGVETAQTGCKV
ncbi:hypothetical protein BV372_02705 [Nostoc sp. T09]|uniref:hypothetical protein n=1 Tax=Nostoc sp. T09 TaxID=1932621 RepID=UPI000B6DFE54|nr:hypothetical protein [Nostoc sp. T09]OUL37326.1 hypothetical protein BV372_02705 [Nostoc sp. T09]